METAMSTYSRNLVIYAKRHVNFSDAIILAVGLNNNSKKQFDEIFEIVKKTPSSGGTPYHNIFEKLLRKKIANGLIISTVENKRVHYSLTDRGLGEYDILARKMLRHAF